MSTIRTITTWKWRCTDRERCDELDFEIRELASHSEHLSLYVADRLISGLECLSLDRKLKSALKELRAERSGLWRKIRQVEVIEEVENGSETGIA